MNINELNEILRHASNDEPWHSECGYIYAPRNDHEGDDGPFRCVGEVAEADADAIVAIHNNAPALVECATLAEKAMRIRNHGGDYREMARLFDELAAVIERLK